MSTSNIVSRVPVGEGLILVTFSTKDGGTRTYQYEGMAAAAILAGADPANYRGRRVG